MKYEKIPQATIARLPLYLRCLETARNSKIGLISSNELARMTGGNAAQLRKDLSYLGEFGTRGVGYDVDELISHIAKWLGVTRTRQVALVGVGKLGQALCNYRGFSDKGFKVAAAYDSDEQKVGRKIAGLTVRHIDDLHSAGESGIDIGVIATPAQVAQAVADILVGAGVKAILNFAPVGLEVPFGVCVRHVDFSTELQIIGFHLSFLEQGLTSSCCD